MYVHLILFSQSPILKRAPVKFFYLKDTRQSEKHILYSM